MKFRIFYAPQCYKTWEKIFVLTSDGNLYCEFLDNFELKKIEESNIVYEKFRCSDYAWGRGVKGSKGVALSNYQKCEQELTWEEYLNLKPSELLSNYRDEVILKQIKWVQSYLSRSGLGSSNWDSENYQKLS